MKNHKYIYFPGSYVNGSFTRMIYPGLFSLIFILSKISVLGQAPAATGTQIPVIINIYNNSTTEADAKAAVAEANKALSQAGATLRVVGVNNVPAGQGGDANGDGKFAPGERGDLRKHGGDELDSLKNEKGIKISFGNEPTSEDPSNPGVSVHTNPTILIKGGRPADSTGQTIAHEVGHVMTLGAGHKIDGATNADAGGHAPDVPGGSGAGNLMAPSDYRTGTNLTADQIAEMEQWKKDHGKTAAQFDSTYPPAKVTQQFGNGSDHILDMGPFQGFFDLDQVFITSYANWDTVKVNFLLAGIIPPSGSYQATYELGLDIDDAPTSGIMYAGLQGVDRIVTVQLISNFGNINSFASVRNTITSEIFPLPVPPIFNTELELYDTNLPGVPTESSLVVKIPKMFLNLIAPEVPAVATTGLGGDIFDNLIFAFDTFRWMNDATFETFSTEPPEPGAPFTFAVTGLLPNSFFDVFVDEMLVFYGELDPTGSFSGMFIFPPNKSSAIIHYLAAQDISGEFAYNITIPRPPNWDLPNTIINDGQNFCYDASQIITAGGNGKTFVVMPGGSATMIAGQKISYLPGVSIMAGGHLHGYISTNGEFCGSPGPPMAPVAMGKDDIQPVAGQSFFKVYPNPTNGNFTLELNGDFESSATAVEIYDLIGEKVLSVRLTGEHSHDFSLSGETTGIYFIRVISGNRVETVKIIKQ